MKESMKWISVEDSLPPIGQNVLAYENVFNHIVLACRVTIVEPNRQYEDWESYSSEHQDIDEHIITHWMELPEPPKEQE